MVLLYKGLLSILKKNEELWTALDIFSRYEVKKKKPKVQNFMKRNLTFVLKKEKSYVLHWFLYAKDPGKANRKLKIVVIFGRGQ